MKASGILIMQSSSLFAYVSLSPPPFDCRQHSHTCAHRRASKRENMLHTKMKKRCTQAQNPKAYLRLKRGTVKRSGAVHSRKMLCMNVKRSARILALSLKSSGKAIVFRLITCCCFYLLFIHQFFSRWFVCVCWHWWHIRMVSTLGCLHLVNQKREEEK